MLPRLMGAQLDKAPTRDLIAYAQAYAAVYELVVMGSSDDVYGSRSVYRNAINYAFMILRARCRKAEAPVERGRILLEMNGLQFGTGAIAYTVAKPPCEGMTHDHLAAEFGRARRSAGEEVRGEAAEAFFLYLRLLCVYLGNGMDLERAWAALLRGCVVRWSAGLSPAGIWEGVTVEEALRRLLVMGDYAALRQDDGLRERLLAVHDAYVPMAAAMSVPGRDMARQELLYEVLSAGLRPSQDRDLAVTLADALRPLAAAPASPAGPRPAALLLRHACRTLIDRIPLQMAGE